MELREDVEFKQPKLTKLKELRKEAGIGQREMANKMLMAKSTYAQKEKGNSAFTLKEAHRAASLFGVDIEELFYPGEDD